MVSDTVVKIYEKAAHSSSQSYCRDYKKYSPLALFYGQSNGLMLK
jgi:hypothetical protein